MIFLLRTRHKLPLLRVCGNQWLSTWPMFRCNKDCWDTSEGIKKREKKGVKKNLAYTGGFRYTSVKQYAW